MVRYRPRVLPHGSSQYLSQTPTGSLRCSQHSNCAEASLLWKSMSWSDDMRCLFCDGKLPLYRKITSGQFCSAKHRNAYWKEQERLAVERLSQTHDSLRAYRPAEADTILATPPVVASSPLSNPFYLDGQRFEEDAVLDFARTASNRDIVTLAGFVRPTPPLASDWYSFASAAAIAPVSFPVPVPEILVTSGASPAFLAAFSGDQPVAQTIDLVSSTRTGRRRTDPPRRPAAHASDCCAVARRRARHRSGNSGPVADTAGSDDRTGH